MPDEQLFDAVRNIDTRLMRVEQILPNLATREELQSDIAPLATREELQAAIAPLATREELQAAVMPLATREELRAAIAPLATRAELHAAIAPLATREEVHEAIHVAIHAAVEPLARRDEMQAALKSLADQLRAEIRDEGERSRRYTDVLIEDLRDDNRLILQHLISLSGRVDALAQR